MIERIKNSLGRIFLKKRLKKKPVEQSNFNNFIKNSRKILLILPDDQESWNFLIPAFEFLLKLKKELFIFLPENRLGSFPLEQRVQSITYNEKDVSRLHLPVNSLSGKLGKQSFDVVIDLNVGENLFYSAVANIVKSDFRIGFIKNDSDLYYNFQIPHEINNEISYRNLLNSLTMF